MHVLTGAHDFYPDPGSGGTGRYVYETSRLLVDRGHDVSVITRRRGDDPRREVVDGIEVFRYDVEVANRAAPTVLPGLYRARKQVLEHVSAATVEGPPDVVSFQGSVTSLLLDGIVENDVPRVLTFHSPWPTEYRLRTRDSRSDLRRWWNARIRRYLEGRLLSRSDGVITLSEYMERRLHRTYGFVADPTVIPGGVDATRFAPGAGPSDLVAGGDPAILTVRRLGQRMGLGMLLEAFATVVDRHPGAHLYIAGDGPLRDELECAAERHDLDANVTFLGYVPRTELPGAYASADLFVLPTTDLEGFGLATLEALASGTPVVGTPVGGTVEVLSGLESDPAVPAPVMPSTVDADALQRAIVEWIELPRGRVASAERTCRRHAVENYRWERTVARLESTLASIAGLTPGERPSPEVRGSGESTVDR